MDYRVRPPLSGESIALHIIANDIEDIQAKGDDALLEKYGLKANDAILAEEKHIPLFEDLLKNYEAKLLAGGAAQNSARGAQYMLGPSSVLYIGCVGADSYAEQLTAANKREGLATEYLIDDQHPTGRCGVVITGHNRSMCTDLAAANHYKLSHLTSPKIWQQVQKARIYYVGGYHLTVCVPAIVALGKEAAGSKDKLMALSLSAPFIPEFFKSQLDEVIPYCDIIIGNETEAQAYAKGHDLDSENIASIAKALAAAPTQTGKSRTAIITQGTLPTIVAIKQGDEVTVKEYPVHVIQDQQIVDTNGAGDAFAGGLLAGLVDGKPLETCVDMGHWLARASIQELGPAYPYPKQTYAAA